MIPPTVLASLALGAAGMFVFARVVTGSVVAGAAAALVWIAWPDRSPAAVPLLPFALWALHRLAAGRRWADALALGALTGLCGISLEGRRVVPLALLAAAFALAMATGQWRGSRFWSRVLLACAVAAILFAVMPLVWTGQPVLATGVSLPNAIPMIVAGALAAAGARRGWTSDAKPAAAAGLMLVIAGGALKSAAVASAGLALLCAISVAAIGRGAATRPLALVAWALPAAALVDRGWTL